MTNPAAQAGQATISLLVSPGFRAVETSQPVGVPNDYRYPHEFSGTIYRPRPGRLCFRPHALLRREAPAVLERYFAHLTDWRGGFQQVLEIISGTFPPLATLHLVKDSGG